jgi:exodeoxyribonuclease V alpha subunit
MTFLEGTVEKVLYQHPESHYTVFRLRARKTGTWVTVTGYLPFPAAGEVLRIEGRWKSHPRYGQQFSAKNIQSAPPHTAADILRFLAGGATPGVGPATAGRLVDAFGDRTLEVIQTDPAELEQVEGIGPARAAAIHQSWCERRGLRQIIDFLTEIGVSGSYGAPLFQRYGAEAVDRMSQSPLQMVEDLPRIGFLLADAVTRHFDLAVDPVERAAACIRHLLYRMADQGHVCAETGSVLSRCRKDYGVGEEDFFRAEEALRESGDTVVAESSENDGRTLLYLRSYYEAETGIARRLQALLSIPSDLPVVEAEPIAAAVVRRHAICPSPEQIRILIALLDRRVGIITGGPGTGKTTLIRSLTAVLESLGRKVALAAPTGRAARRLSELSRRPAFTLHKLLEFRPTEEEFARHRDRPLAVDAVIVDEASMIDTLLMQRLLDAVAAGSRIVFVGDVFQLPAVGAGNVLADMIESGKIPVFFLNEVFRQEKESPIVENAHRIRQGLTPRLPAVSPLAPDAPFVMLPTADAEKAEAAVIELCCKGIPERFGLDPMSDIQVLCPMHKGGLGTIHLNQRLQQALNPSPEGVLIGGMVLKTGDKIMQLKNDYEKEVFNGEIGVIADIDPAASRFAAHYDGRAVTYAFAEADRLALAYAVTVHKSQGSEYPAVVFPLTRQHRPMLQRNLLYTAVTRARQLVVLVGSRQALSAAIANDRSVRRMTGLKQLLAGLRMGPI